MGHIINPLSQRIGYSSFWNSNWSLSCSSQNFAYSYVSIEDTNLNVYLKKLFLYAGCRLFGRGLIFLGFKLLRFQGQIILLINIKLKQLITLYNAVELIFLNSQGLGSISKKYQNSKVNLIQNNANKKNFKKLYFVNLLKPPLSYKIKPKFLRRTMKLTPYNSVITEPDFWSYHWTNLVENLYLNNKNKLCIKSKMLNSNLQKNIVDSTITYVLLLRWLFSIKKFITNSLLRFYRNCAQFDIIISLLSTAALSASFISKYLATRLLQKFPLRRLINLLIKQLKIACESGNIQGFKIACNGRFERRGRATHIWKLLGKIPRSDVNIKVDYSIMLPVLTNSICAVKVWLTRKYEHERLLTL